jgi:MSHA biogenesis protein MshL
MKQFFVMFLLLALVACSSPNIKTDTRTRINKDMDALLTESAAPSKTDAVNNALLPPLTIPKPKVDSTQLEPRFDLTVNNTPAKEVFTAIGSGSRYNMLPLPGVDGNITLNLKDVTIFEALDTISALYGYEYDVQGKSIYIQPVTLQIKLFKIDYLAAMRDSSSSISVKASGQAATSSTVGGTAPVVTPGGAAQSANSSFVTTKQSATDFNFWQNLQDALTSIITPKEKDKSNQIERSVVINRMSGVIVVRAMPEELRNVAEFLKASQLSVERQVIIEAKFIEVTLSDSYQSGVNWAAIGTKGGSNYSTGIVSQGVTQSGTVIAPNLLPNATGGAGQAMANGAFSATPGVSLAGGMATGAQSSLFGLAFQTNNFAAMLNFLETQGSVHVLSSPRISTLNNQKAVLKVGVDEPYATGFTPGTSTTVSGGSNTLPTPIYTPMFSGIALDVTPRINDKDEIILHVHPSISQVNSVTKDAGSGSFIQMASTSIEETDSVVRAKDSQIVVIGGLMSQSTTVSNSGLPGWIKSIFGQTSKSSSKRELVILLKPTVVDNDKDWSDEISRTRDRMNGMSR